ncbi:MAG: ion transporter, partial [Chloroflexi bacterium]|nr:ion transporter [Chloroflexota bacterium]
MTMASRSTATPTAPDAVPVPPQPGSPHRRTLKEIATEAIHDPTSNAYAVTLKVILVAILASIVVLALETIHPLVDDYADLFHAIDLSLLAIFTAEYFLNLWVAPDRRKYALSLWGIVDLLAILPAYIELTLGGVASLVFLRQLRILRVMRMLKLLKLAAEQAALSAAKASEKKSSFLMDIQIYGICLFTVMTISSSLMYQFEGVSPGVPELTGEAVTALADAGKDGKETPEWFADPMAQIYAERAGKGWSNPVYTFTSVPKAYWWSIVTLTTTGYGDMFPVTMGGRIVAGLTMLSGLALFSLLTSVVGRALMTSLFGKGGDDESPRTKVFIIGNHMPAAFNVAEYIRGPASMPGGETMQPVARRSSDVGLLERPFLEGKVSIGDITQSAAHVADSIVASTSEASEFEASGLVIGPNSSWFDRLVYASFVDHGSRLYEPVHRALTGFIFLSVVLVVLDSVDWIHDEYHTYFEVLETFIVFFFTFEFIANYRIAPRKLGYVFSLWGMIDLLAVIPTYVTLAVYVLGYLGVP